MLGLLFIRNTLSLSQSEVARILGCSLSLVKQIETARRPVAKNLSLPLLQLSHLAQATLDLPPATPTKPDKTEIEKELRMVRRNIMNIEYRHQDDKEAWAAYEQMMHRLNHVGAGIERKSELSAAAFELVRKRKESSPIRRTPTQMALAEARLAGWRAQEAVLVQALQDA